MLDSELLESLSGKQKVNTFANYAPRQHEGSSVNTEYHRSGSAIEAAILAKELPKIRFESSRVVGRRMGEAEF
ncbi:hypothetical protein FWH30_02750 [Microgenomates group bacterium]|nr:hypothetical protein [Microgenomates group bacterium]